MQDKGEQVLIKSFMLSLCFSFHYVFLATMYVSTIDYLMGLYYTVCRAELFFKSSFKLQCQIGKPIGPDRPSSSFLLLFSSLFFRDYLYIGPILLHEASFSFFQYIGLKVLRPTFCKVKILTNLPTFNCRSIEQNQRQELCSTYFLF